MTDSGSAHPLRKVISMKRWLVPIAVGAAVAGCGGGGGGGDGASQQPPPVVINPPSVTLAQAQFVDEKFEGVGVRAAGAADSVVDASGKFNFVVGQPVQFFVGTGANRAVVGNATLTPVANGVAPISLHDLNETKNDGDQYLGNLLAWVAAIDDNGDLSDGVRIEAAAREAVAAGGRRRQGGQLCSIVG